jgi:hydroxymethylbilane synthase
MLETLYKDTLTFSSKKMILDTQIKTLRIGVRMEPWAKLFGVYTQGFLKDHGIESQLILFRDNLELLNSLLSGEVNICPAGLKDMPTTLPEGITLAALSARDDARQCLVLPRFIAEKADLTTLKGLKIGVCTESNGRQLEHLFPEVTTEVHNMMPLEGIEAMRNGTFDGGIMTIVTTNVLAMRDDEWLIRPFNPREFVPEAGQGVACLLAATDDVTTRRLLKTVHNPNVALATNVERTLKKMFNDTNINAYCERDKMGNYHLNAAALVNGQLQKVRLSRSTTIGLAESAKAALMNDN